MIIMGVSRFYASGVLSHPLTDCDSKAERSSFTDREFFEVYLSLTTADAFEQLSPDNTVSMD
jgi:hypothetical protein